MIESLITSKTRLKLLLKFFLNPDNKAYLRSLESEFEESSNGIRVELNRLEKAELLCAQTEGNKKMYSVNTKHPLYEDINNIVRKYLGLDILVQRVVDELGGLSLVYLTGRMAKGLESEIVELSFVGDINKDYLQKVVAKAETLLSKKIQYLVFNQEADFRSDLNNEANLLLWSA